MKLTREHKILGLILSLGVSALGVDRLVIGSEQTSPPVAEAAAYVAASTPEPEEASSVLTPTLPTKPAPSGPSIAEKLRATEQHQAAVLQKARDGFIPSESWYGEQTPTAASGSQADPIAQFLSHHTLSAVMNKRIAIVNGQTYQVGDWLVDFQLVAVHSEGATFAYRGQHVDLTLDQTVQKHRR